MWDNGWGLGILKGQLFQSLLESSLGAVKKIEDCPIPLGVTTYNIQRFRTSIRNEGELATAIRASATFPIMFQPVTLDNHLHIDGGIFDQYGLVALPTLTCEQHNEAPTVPAPASVSGFAKKKKCFKTINGNLPPLVLNVLFDNYKYTESMIPEQHRHCRILTITLNDVPQVNPVSTMQYDGKCGAERRLLNSVL